MREPKNLRRPSVFRFSLWLAIALLSGADRPACGQNWFREVLGLDGGKRRVARESIVRAPDGTWCVETPEGLRPHSSQPQYAAAESLYARKSYADAAKAFRRLGDAHKGSAMQEDCIFYEAECYFHDGHLPKAVDTYNALLKDFPSTRHLPVAVQRTYDVAAEWLEDSRLRATGRPGKYDPVSRNVNFLDRRRPLLDTTGRAIEAIEHIQQYDPNGPLTASATMMAGAYRFTNNEHLQAAGYYEQVVTEQPKCEFAAKAAVLAAKAYLRAYQGPEYDAKDLLDAERMTTEALRRGAELDADTKSRLEADLRQIRLLKAERELHLARVYAKQWKWMGAKVSYEKVIENYPDTEWAQRAKAELATIQPRIAELKNPKSTFSLGMFGSTPSKASPSAAAASDAGPGRLPTESRDGAVRLAPAKQ